MVNVVFHFWVAMVPPSVCRENCSILLKVSPQNHVAQFEGAPKMLTKVTLANWSRRSSRLRHCGTVSPGTGVSVSALVVPE